MVLLILPKILHNLLGKYSAVLDDNSFIIRFSIKFRVHRNDWWIMELFQDSVDDTEEELHPEQILMHAEQTYR
jgi:hypothetical protein